MERIEINPNIHFGKPCIAGTRISVLNVLELVSDGIPFEEITKKYYPDITVDDIRVCIKYAMDVITVEDIHFANQK
ncbi:MAG: DUF433 domain-containing protein [Bacteroidota bacterium]|nr:DUF433 domain-containing protein [Bacteroidota bacterium]